MPSTFTTGDLNLELPEQGNNAWKPAFDADMEAIDTGVSALNRRIGGVYANINAIKAIAVADRSDGMLVIEGSEIPYKIFRFHANDTAIADDAAILQPDAGTGRWRIYQSLNLTSDQTNALAVTGVSASNKFASENSVSNGPQADSVADLTALAAVTLSNIRDYQFRYVVSMGAEFLYDPASTDTDDGETVIDPAEHTGQAGRWIKVLGGGGANLDIINATLSVTTLNDIFIYDTSLDSDAGLWREYTQNRSWYREFIEDGTTSTRDSKAKFPAMALLVAEDDQLTVYDMDSGPVKMWAVFHKGSGVTQNMIGQTTASTGSCCYAKNGHLYFGCDGANGGLYTIDLILDFAKKLDATDSYINNKNIRDRNTTNTWISDDSGQVLQSAVVNDMDGMVLANTTINTSRNMVDPAIILGTDSGANVITADGTVYDVADVSGDDINYVAFNADEKIICGNETQSELNIYNPPFATDRDDPSRTYSLSSTPSLLTAPGATDNGHKIAVMENDELALITDDGLCILAEHTTQEKGMVCFVKHLFNTGWMPGAIKLAALCTADNTETGIDDRSANSNDLTKSGTISVSAVATGAEIQGFSGFGAADFFYRAFDADFDFGTNDFCTLFWLRQNGGTSKETIISRAFYSGGWSGSGWGVYVSSDGKINFEITDDGYVTTDTITSDDAYDDNIWHLVVAVRNGTELQLYIDGMAAATSVTITNATNSLDNVNATLRIGLDQNIANALAFGTLAQVRIAATAPTAAQILKAYHDEKFMFHEDANVSLVGTINGASTAVSYDSTDKEIMVSSNTGLSKFRGLIRIAEDTGANYQSLKAISTVARNRAYGGGTVGLLEVTAQNLREELVKLKSGIQTSTSGSAALTQKGKKYNYTVNYNDTFPKNLLNLPAENKIRSISVNESIAFAGGEDETVLLIQSINEANGSTNFVDKSNSGHVVSVYGDAQHSTTQVKFGTSSIKFDGSGDYLQVADHTDFTFGTGDLTAECWVYKAGGDATNMYFLGQCDGGGTPSAHSIKMSFTAANTLQFSINQGSTFYNLYGTTNVLANSGWHHVAGVRDGNTLRLYIDGVQEASADVTGVSVNDVSYKFGIGVLGELTGGRLNGYLEDVRVIKGVCKYPDGTTFTVPSSPFTVTPQYKIGYSGNDDSVIYYLKTSQAQGYLGFTKGGFYNTSPIDVNQATQLQISEYSTQSPTAGQLVIEIETDEEEQIVVGEPAQSTVDDRVVVEQYTINYDDTMPKNLFTVPADYALTNLTMQEIEAYADAGDPDIVLLLQSHDAGDGSTNFIDTTGRHTITTGGSPTHSTNSSKFDTSSLRLQNAYWQCANSSDWDFGSGEWTIDFWMRRQETGTSWAFGRSDSGYSTSSTTVAMRFNGSNYPEVAVAYGGNISYTTSGEVITDTENWYHYAAVRDNDTIRLYVNGVQKASNNIGGNTLNAANDPFCIGKTGSYPHDYNSAYYEEFRVIKGRCLYPNGTTFSVPTAPVAPQGSYKFGTSSDDDAIVSDAQVLQATGLIDYTPGARLTSGGYFSKTADTTIQVNEKSGISPTAGKVLVTATMTKQAQSPRILNQTTISEGYYDICPIGVCLPWHKNLAGIPALPGTWIECNGQVISDLESPLVGQRLPNLNGSAVVNIDSFAAQSGGTQVITLDDTRPDYLVVGTLVEVSGAANWENMGVFKITAVGASTITVDNGDGVVEASESAATLTTPGMFIVGGSSSGTYAPDQLQHHGHEWWGRSGNEYAPVPSNSWTMHKDIGTQQWASQGGEKYFVRYVDSDYTHEVARTGFQTMPVNFSMVWIMRIK